MTLERAIWLLQETLEIVQVVRDIYKALNRAERMRGIDCAFGPRTLAHQSRYGTDQIKTPYGTEWSFNEEEVIGNEVEHVKYPERDEERYQAV